MTFMPLGYTPARAIPVKSRRANATEVLPGPKPTNATFAIAPTTPETTKTRRAGKTWAMLKMLATTAPTTKPICTASVSPTASPDERPH